MRGGDGRHNLGRNYRCSQIPDCGFDFVLDFFSIYFLHLYPTALVLVGGKQKVQSCLFIYEQKEKGILGVGGVKIQRVLEFYSLAVKQGVTSKEPAACCESPSRQCYCVLVYAMMCSHMNCQIGQAELNSDSSLGSASLWH